MGEVNVDIDILVCELHIGEMRHLCRIPNIRWWLAVSTEGSPAAARLWEGLLLVEGHIKGGAPKSSGHCREDYWETETNTA